MMTGFDNEKYLKVQSKKIKERFNLFDKLYLEVGGKLFDDTHAERILPGFKKDSKLEMFKELKDDLEIIMCINANDIEKNKVRGDLGISYDTEVLRLIDNLRRLGFYINSVVITLYNNQSRVKEFINKLELNNVKTYIHTFTKGYPTDVDTIVSEEGYGANPYIETTKKLILVNAPGPGSGKLATCLSQLYHEHKNGVNAGYAKFETFPVWNLSLKHPVNIAYEAATADLKDFNMIDPFHLEEYNIKTVNYNRDVEMFPVLKNILYKITKSDIYKSPTDMGVNMIGNCINDEEKVIDACKKEIIRRYFDAMHDYKLGKTDKEVPERIKILMNSLDITEDYISCRKVALNKKIIKNSHIAAIKIKNKTICGKETELLSPVSSMFINTIKELTKIPDDIKLIPENFLKPILKNRPKSSIEEENTLQLSEVLIALSICSATNPTIEKALENIDKLIGQDVYITYIIPNGEIKTLRRLGMNVIMEPVMYSEDKFIY
ncbi:MAG: DUF1846 domain-containing protein [archaeon]|nr:DUF1846 domain-containing protein [archaeon]